MNEKTVVDLAKAYRQAHLDRDKQGVSRQRVYQMLKEHGYGPDGVKVAMVPAEAPVVAMPCDEPVSVDAMQDERAMRSVTP